MTLALSTDKAVYYVGDTAAATLTGTEAELARTWADLGTVAGGLRSGLKYAVPGLIVWTDTASRTWTVTDRTTTSVTATTGPLVGTGAATVTATIGAAHADAAYTVNSTTPPAGVRKLKGISPWFNPYVGALVNRADALLAPDWVGSMSAFARWNHITSDGVTYKYTGYDKVSAAAAKAHKPWALMVILGSATDGLPGHVLSGVPAKEWIETDGERFPVFWSPTANALLQAFLGKLATRYASDPWLAQVRVVGFWSINGEPWFAGGDPGKPKWCKAWRDTHPADAGLSDDATLVKVKAAYQAQELAWWAAAAAMWPSHIALAQAAGDGLYDNALSPAEWEQPGRHPARLATWTTVRNLYTTRSVFQFNGVNGEDGASGYGRWIPNSFGPVSPSTTGDTITVPAERRGRIGSQPVGGINKETIVGGLPKIRLTFAQAVSMIRHLTAWKYSYCEVYGTDVASALDATAGEWVTIRNVFNEQKGNWYP